MIWYLELRVSKELALRTIQIVSRIFCLWITYALFNLQTNIIGWHGCEKFRKWSLQMCVQSENIYKQPNNGMNYGWMNNILSSWHVFIADTNSYVISLSWINIYVICRHDESKIIVSCMGSSEVLARFYSHPTIYIYRDTHIYIYI